MEDIIVVYVELGIAQYVITAVYVEIQLAHLIIVVAYVVDAKATDITIVMEILARLKTILGLDHILQKAVRVRVGIVGIARVKWEELLAQLLLQEQNVNGQVALI